MARSSNSNVFACVIVIAFSVSGVAAKDDPVAEKERIAKYSVKITSSKDGSAQDALFYCPPEAAPGTTGAPVPLMVSLHSWSSTYTNCAGHIPIAERRKWVLVSPNFRGPNKQPDACASPLAIQDILDAVEYAKKNARVDTSRIYLVGGSGGGHMSLVMAGASPETWAGVSAWVPISDLIAWHAESTARKSNYWKMMEQSCGGPPGPATEAQYKARSPIFSLPNAKNLPLDINTGIHDGHTGSVPVSQSLRAFNVLAQASGAAEKQVSEADIAFMVEQRKIPDALAAQREDDPERTKRVLFRRVAGAARVTVFEGGHDVEMEAGLDWLSRQEKGKPANFALASAADVAKRPRGKAQEVSK